jgi:hypothetical protein
LPIVVGVSPGVNSYCTVNQAAGNQSSTLSPPKADSLISTEPPYSSAR